MEVRVWQLQHTKVTQKCLQNKPSSQRKAKLGRHGSWLQAGWLPPPPPLAARPFLIQYATSCLKPLLLPFFTQGPFPLACWHRTAGQRCRRAFCCCHSSAPSAGRPRSPPAGAERGLCHRGLIARLVPCCCVKLPLLLPTTLGLCRSHVCPPEAGCQAASQPLASPFCSGSSVQKHRERFKEQAKR